MVVPPLSQFIHTVPTSLVSNVPTVWLEDCLAGGTHCLVLVNEQATPVSVLPLHHLLNMVGNWTSPPLSLAEARSTETGKAFAGEETGCPLAGYATTAIAVVAVNLPLETVAQIVAADPDTDWVVVDASQRYLGLLDKPRLLAAALNHAVGQPDAAASLPAIALPESATAAQSDASAVSQQQTAQSNTALLTYLGHELKTPLTSLLGLSSLLKTERLGELNVRQTRYVNLIQQHCRRLAAWVNTLIDLGRIESGTLRLIPRLVNLAAIWRDAYQQAALRVGQEEAQPPAPPALLREEANALTLVADPPRLQQMLTCLMQTALVTQVPSAAPSELPLKVEIWNHWVVFITQGLEEELYLDYLSQATFNLPFPTTPAIASPISGEMGHWLEWLLVRKLAQLHRGELATMAHPHYGICPTLILPTPTAPRHAYDSRLLLLVAPAQAELIKTLQQEANQLNYRLLITHQIEDALEIASHLQLSAILMLIESSQSVAALSYLKGHLPKSEPLLVALVPPQWSAFLGEMAADRELLWPTDRLGSVLLQPPPSAPAPSRLTVLYLKTSASDLDLTSVQAAHALRLPNIFHDFGCRVLEVDDLEQAGLLRRVWNPDVAILDPAIADPAGYLDSLSHFPELTSLPLITLTLAATQAAHEFPTLAVFPCLVSEAAWDTPDASDRMATWLIQVLQVAATHQP